MSSFDESHVEEAALAWLHDAGWQVVHGSDIAADTPGAKHFVGTA